MNFGQAIKRLKDGAKVQREGWRERLVLADASIVFPGGKINTLLEDNSPADEPRSLTHADMLAEDWLEVPGQKGYLSPNNPESVGPLS